MLSMPRSACFLAWPLFIFTFLLCHSVALENLLNVVNMCPTVQLYLFLLIPILPVCWCVCPQVVLCVRSACASVYPVFTRVCDSGCSSCLFRRACQQQGVHKDPAAVKHTQTAKETTTQRILCRWLWGNSRRWGMHVHLCGYFTDGLVISSAIIVI